MGKTAEMVFGVKLLYHRRTLIAHLSLPRIFSEMATEKTA
jgi:hypothetical protein